MDEFIIKKNRGKIGGLIFFLCLLNFISAFMIFNPDLFISTFTKNSLFIFIVGILCFIHSFLMIISNILVLINKEAAVVITDSELIDNSNYESLGAIEWSDIVKIETFSTYSGKYMELTIGNKEKYLKKYKKNLLKRYLIFMNNWKPRETIILNSRKLNCTFEELESSIVTRWRNYNS